MAVNEGSTGAVGRSEKTYPCLEGFLEEVTQAEFFRWKWVRGVEEQHFRKKNLPL